MCRSSLDGNREIPRLASRGAPLWPASGRRGAVADDERTWEVRLRNSSWEADEQSRATGCGVGGASTRVENAISSLLPHGRVLVADVARDLGMSERTLARKL